MTAQLEIALAACELTACRTCTCCAHGKHAACRTTVTCPTDGDTRDCECCRPRKQTAGTTEESK